MEVQITTAKGSNTDIFPKAINKANTQTSPKKAPIGNRINESTLYRLVKNML